MSRFNTRGHQAKPAVATATSPLGTSSKTTPDTRTFEGADGWLKDARTDLFLRASSSFNDGGDKFYETGYERDRKARELAQQLAVEDIDWFAPFVLWLRRTANIRTQAIMTAADGVKARLDAGLQAPGNSVMPTNREIIDSVLYRADEPGELLAYWMHQYGRRIPKPVKRGIGDGVRRLYNEKTLLKYDTASHAVRFADVLELCHPGAAEDKLWQGDLFKFAIDRRHGRANDVPESLQKVRRNAVLRSEGDAVDWLDADALREAGMTWEDSLSAVGSKVEKAKLWESVIPSMGYMALIRNLRNFDEAGVSDTVAAQVVARLTDPDEVEKSRQLPFRFYSAYTNVASLRWSYALEKALDLATSNIPELAGRTLILTDTSQSMTNRVSDKSSLQCLEVAGLFGSALAMKNAGRVDMFQYATRTAPIVVPKGGSVLKMTEAIRRHQDQVGWGTDIAGAIRATYKGHARVVVLTDGQGASYNPAASVASDVPSNVPVYIFNIQSYSASPMPTGGAARFDLGGLSDQTFKLIPLLEQGGRNGSLWPWEVSSS